MADRKTRGTSLRNPLAALARVNEAMGRAEKNVLTRSRDLGEAKQLRTLAQKEPDLRGAMLRRQRAVER